jgi:hypothetical protein
MSEHDCGPPLSLDEAMQMQRERRSGANRFIGLCLEDPDDYSELSTAAYGPVTLVRVQNIADILEGVIPWSAIVLEVSRLTADARREMVRWFTGPVLLRSDLRISNVRETIRLAGLRPNAHLSLRRADGLASGIGRLTAHQSYVPAHATLVATLCPVVPIRVLDIVFAAVHVSARRSPVSALAQVCRTSIRTVEWKLKRCGVPPARRLLGGMLCLHAAWELDAHQSSIKVTASTLGFVSRASLGNFLRRHLDCSPTDVQRDNRFQEMLDRFVLQFSQ